MKKIFAKYFSLIIFIFFAYFHKSYTQNSNGYQYSNNSLNTITTAVPFLTISPDARTSGFGDAGVATNPDANSQHWNPAKYAFLENKAGIGLSYSPWMKALKNDINLGYFSAYFKPDDKNAFAISVRYFSLGNITMTNYSGSVIGTVNPVEHAGDASYSRKISDFLSLGITLRYIYSDLLHGMNIGGIHPGSSIAGDFSMFYSKPVCIFKKEGRVNFGMNISNIGSKISYTESTERDFIPANLRIGSSVSIKVNDNISFSLQADINKLLVPTSPVYETDSNGMIVIGIDGNPVIVAGKDPNVSVLAGTIQSFYDAPGGFKEEIREINCSLGTECLFKNIIFARTGFFYEDKTKGNRKYYTLGAGIKFNQYRFDTSYLISVEQHNPLMNTLRFSFLYYFD